MTVDDMSAVVAVKVAAMPVSHYTVSSFYTHCQLLKQNIWLRIMCAASVACESEVGADWNAVVIIEAGYSGAAITRI